MGPGGEAAAWRLLQAGKRVAVVERELIGGECAYWACIPSKTLLRAPEAKAEAARAAGVATPGLDWPELRGYRDYMVRHLDDAAQVRGYEQAGATVIKGEARLAGPGKVEANGELLEAEHVLIATGSQPLRPAIDGLDRVPVWTNREATAVRDIPGQVLLIGGSAVGVELGLFYARMGSRVTVVQRAGRLIDREDPRVGELARDALAAEGVTVHTGRTAARARPVGRDRAASYHGIPRVVFADPEIAATGYTSRQARDRGIEVVTAEVALADAIGRPWTYERDPRGTLGLLADRHRRVLVGAWAVAPLASEWIHQAALAIRTQIPIATLLDQVAQFPTYSEAYLAGLEQLDL